jgi:hypothetical protein
MKELKTKYLLATFAFVILSWNEVSIFEFSLPQTSDIVSQNYKGFNYFKTISAAVEQYSKHELGNINMQKVKKYNVGIVNDTFYSV